MFCSNCGREKKETKFCPYCGAKQEDMLSPENIENKSGTSEYKEKGNIRKCIVFFVVLIVIGLVILVFVKGNKSEKFIELLKKGEHQQAEKYYQTNLVGDEEEVQKVYKIVLEEINTLVEQYYEDKISFDDVQNGLDTYSAFYKTETLAALRKVDKLKKSKDSFEYAEEKIVEEDYRGAYYAYEEVIEEDRHYATAREKMNNCYAVIVEQIFHISEMKISEGDYLSAISNIEGEMIFFNEEDYNKATSKKQEYLDAYIEVNKIQVEQYLLENRYSECMDLLKAAVASIDENEELKQMQLAVIAAYEQHISNLVNEQITKRDFINAADILNTAKGELPNSTLFVELTNKLAEYTPVSIYTLKPYTVGLKLPQSSSYEDTMGNVYNKTFRIVSSSGYYNIYDISQKYSILTGIIAVPYESVGAEGNGYVRIYGDNVLLWENNSISSTTKPYEISVNISGVTDLKIEMGGAKGYQGVHVLFANVTLQK